MVVTLVSIIPLVPFGDVIGGWMLRFLTGFLDTALSLALTFFVSVTAISTTLLHSPIVHDAVTYTQQLGTVLLVVKVFGDMYKDHIRDMSGEDSNVRPGGYIVRGISALLVIWSTPWIVEELITVGNLITADVAALDGTTSTHMDFIDSLKQTFLSISKTVVFSDSLALLGSLFSLVVGICLVIIVFQMAKRSVEVCFMAIVGPVFSVSLAGEDHDVYKAWFRHLCVLCGSQALQILILRITFWAVAHSSELAFDTGPIIILIGFALMGYCIKAPKFIEQFSYGTGSGQGRASGVVSMASTVINLVSKAK